MAHPTGPNRAWRALAAAAATLCAAGAVQAQETF